MKKIPSIHQPIQKSDGSMEYVWYLFLQWVSENTGKVDLSDYFTKEEIEELLAPKVDADDLANVAFTGDYDDLINKPTIPTVGDGTITVKQGGVTKGTFTVNQSGNTEINIDEGGGAGDGITITENSNEELQAIGVINKNTETGATNPIYDWVGTEAEYEAQNIATLHPEWLCFITDDCANTESLIIHREVAERNMGELVYSTIPVIDSGLHLADGELLDGAGIYADFYNYMVGVYNAGHTSIFCSEADWQTSDANYGKCGKYVLDTINQTIRLPKIPGFVEGTLTEAEIGNRVAPGVPNITGNIGMNGLSYGGGNATKTGVFSNTILNGSSNGVSSIASGNGNTIINFNASASNNIYGNSTTVQPESVRAYVYVVIANTAKTPVEVDIDNIATELSACYAHRVVEFLAPTAANNYTWYRKYADGWVEQGGITTSGTTVQSVVLPVTMADTYYTIQLTATGNASGSLSNTTIAAFENVSTTGFDTRGNVVNQQSQSSASTGAKRWYVCGMAARGD